MKIRVNKVFISAKIRNAEANKAIKRQPITAPIEIAKNVFQGFIPINLPTIDPTRPPEP